ncbi:MAG: EamA family transporter, partial [Spirochaetota bacterium]
MKKVSSRFIGLSCLVVTILLFSTFEVTSKVLAPYMNPLQITFSRFLIGGIVLLPFALARMKRKHLELSVRDFTNIGLLGFVNIVVSM